MHWDALAAAAYILRLGRGIGACYHDLLRKVRSTRINMWRDNKNVSYYDLKNCHVSGQRTGFKF